MTQQQSLKDFLNMAGNTETEIFLKSTKKKTSQMKYHEFIKHGLASLNPVIREYMDSVDKQLKECATITAIEKLQVPALPKHIMEAIIDLVDKQKLLDIVEKTYVALDMIRAISTNIGNNVGKMALHYGNTLRKAPKIVGSDGKSL